MVGHALGVLVLRHDDGSEAGMYDLRVGPAETPEHAIEVCRAADEGREESNAIDGKTAITSEPRLSGTWSVEVAPRVGRRGLAENLVPILADLEARYRVEDLFDVRLSLEAWREWPELERRGVVVARRHSDGHGGRLWIRNPSMGGGVDTLGTALPSWASGWAWDHEDNRAKLARSSAPYRHLIVPVMFGAAPWSVQSYLTGLPLPSGALSPAPEEALDLPPEITHMWIAYSAAQWGWRWSADEGWSRFRAGGPPVDERQFVNYR